tara:strand:+ start:126646 stop:126753 length:108 start_codon:yes stop_codon:yes gene_type:complete
MLAEALAPAKQARNTTSSKRLQSRQGIQIVNKEYL